MAAPKKYGLIIPKGKVQAKPRLATKASVFGDESSDEECSGNVKVKAAINRALVQESQKKATNMQAKVTMAKALEEDPTVYQYDEVYDAMEDSKRSLAASKKVKDKKPKYVQSLLRNAAVRKLEDERRQERQAHREREKEGDEFDDKDAFITPSYKKKLEELRAVEEEARRREAEEAANDVTKQKDLSNFYRNLLSRNVSKAGRFADQGTPDVPTSTSEVTKEESTKAERESSSLKEKQAGDVREEFSDSKSRAPAVTADQADDEGSSSTEESESESSIDEQVPEPAPQPVALKRPPERSAPEPAAKTARRNDEVAVMSARERYLQRKQQQLAAKKSAAST